MRIKLNNELGTCIAIFIITVSESVFAVKLGLDAIIECLGYAILFYTIFNSITKTHKKQDKQKIICFSIVIFLLMSVGLFFQDITTKRLFTLLFTVFGILGASTLSFDYLKNTKIIRNSAYALLFGIIVSAFLGLLVGENIIVSVNKGEGIGGIPLAVSGGILYKNYFASDMLAIYWGLYFYGKIEKTYKIDQLVKIIAFFLCILSNSRGGILLFIVFWLVTNYKIIYKLKKNQRMMVLMILFFFGVLVSINLYTNVILEVSTYAYRFRGMTNYIDYYKNDLFHLVFGNAESFYDKGKTYVMMVRSTTGYDGSLEMAWLNIIIKSGLLGIVGYILLFIRFFYMAKKTNNTTISMAIISISVTLLASSIVEAYIQSIHCIFGIYAYLLINGLYAYGNEKGMVVEK